MLNRQSLIGPWAGIPIAWTEDDEFDEATYRNDLQQLCQVGVRGVYTGGSTGEFYALDENEFRRISHITVEVCHAFDIPVMIGCTSTSTRGTCRNASYAADIGADAIQLALPFWLEVQDSEIVPFFLSVSRAASYLPLSIYETNRAKKCLTIRQHREVHEAVPSYCMVKSTNGTVGCTKEGCESLSSFVNVFVSEKSWSVLGPFGAVGSCSAMVYWNPHIVETAWNYLHSQDWTALESICQQFIELHEFLFREFGLRGFTDSAYDRMVSRATGFLATSLRCRAPYVSPAEIDVRAVRHWLENYYPEMLELKRFYQASA